MMRGKVVCLQRIILVYRNHPLIIGSTRKKNNDARYAIIAMVTIISVFVKGVFSVCESDIIFPPI